MIRNLLFALALVLPLAAQAQAFRCVDAATGRVLYTDQPCKGGETVVPERTPDQIRDDAERAEAARVRAIEQREQTLERQQDRLQQQENALAQARPPLPSESDECRAARREAAFRAASISASTEQIRTARANAALACGQPAPEEIVVVPPHRGWDQPRDPGWWSPPPVRPRPPHRPGSRPQQPKYPPGEEPLPLR